MKYLASFVVFSLLNLSNPLCSQDLETGLEPTSVAYLSADGSVTTEPIRKPSEWSSAELDKLFRATRSGARSQILVRSVSSKVIQDELEMTENQRAAIAKSLESFNASSQTLRGKYLVDGILQKDSEREFQKQADSQVSDMFRAIERELLPHQIKQVDALASRYAYQSVVEHVGRGAELRWPLMMTKVLGLTAADESKLKAQIEKIERQFGEECSKIRQDALKDLLGKLPPTAKNVFGEAAQEPLDPKLMAAIFQQMTETEPMGLQYLNFVASQCVTENQKPAGEWSADELEAQYSGFRSGAKKMLFGRAATSSLIQEELELSEQQKAAVITRMEALGKKLKEIKDRHTVDGVVAANKLEMLIKDAEEFGNKFVEGIEEELLPHQLKQLDQLASRFAYQQLLKKCGKDAELRWPLMLGKGLGLSAADQTKLKGDIDELEREMHKKIAKAQQEALERLLTELPSEAKGVFEEAVKEDLDPKVRAEIFK